MEPLLPPPRTGPKGGRREKHARRRIVDAIFYVVRTGCAWRQLPHDFPPWQTVYWYFVRWHDEGTVARLHDVLRVQVRQAEGREAEPPAGLIDSQSVRTADTAPSATRGFGAGKKVKGRSWSPIPSACCWPSTSWPRASRTAREPSDRCCGHVWTTRQCGRSGPTRASPAAWSTGLPISSAANWRSSASAQASAASRSNPSGGRRATS
ncbi:transposase [Streptomyces sp. NBC_01571]|uniref:transposase n=1 Tax=Streptomyces sp. NBC_01571 TaxID=2975883 RepID=UPI00338FB416